MLVGSNNLTNHQQTTFEGKQYHTNDGVITGSGQVNKTNKSTIIVSNDQKGYQGGSSVINEEAIDHNSVSSSQHITGNKKNILLNTSRKVGGGLGVQMKNVAPVKFRRNQQLNVTNSKQNGIFGPNDSLSQVINQITN